ncbi:HAMP domain-containing sensor histidine kinase [Lentzea sp. DG1S-22]|uniref:sensor histidine kinase n=1 Tax=Lentzea sp. DG1S-22 TaxID=3108822 RepID=UPI002E75C52B|nr:HAMP domain-containing sensor histidine kinase [Lentzea sp. DG1S-22]WVH81808.1 HAMP domain-containing sensor histidine kinase [Lentzea sp. DG1S-22]
MRSLQFKVTALATVITALLIALAGSLMLVAQRDQITAQTADSSRRHYMCSVVVCVPLHTRTPVTTPVSPVHYASTEIRPKLSLWPLSDPAGTPYQVAGEGPEPVAENARSIASQAQDELNRAALTLLSVLASVTALVSITVLATTVRVLRPVEVMRAELAEINEHNLTRRVPVPSADNEIARLGATLNETLDRVHRGVEDTRRFVADASHELRSPLAALRAELEIALSHPHMADWPTVVKAALEDAERLQELTTDLLLLARLDADALDKQDTVDLSAVVAREVSRRAMVTLDADEHVLVPGRRAQLSRLLGNLLDNAERHAGAAVVVRLRGGTTATLEVIDDGPGIPEADRERVFDRFTRLDEARTRAAGGAGLGLAIARRIATRHQGTLEATDAEGFRGIRFVATIPTGIPQQRTAAVLAQQRVGDEVWQFLNGSIVPAHGHLPEPRPAPVPELDWDLIFGEHRPVST